MVSERLGQYLEHKGISFYAVENAVGASRGAISKAVKEGKNIGANVLENILIHYPDLNPIWLMKGEGEMIISNNVHYSNSNKIYGVTEATEMTEYMMLQIVQNINENESEWLKLPEFKKLLKSLSLSSEMADMRSELKELKKQFQKHLDSTKK